MRHRIKALQGDRLVARDGEVGKVEDLYFDDRRWTVRYVAVRAGAWSHTVLGWDPGRQVLLPPSAVEAASGEGEEMRVRLSRAEVEQATPGEDVKPLWAQYEELAKTDPHLRSSSEVMGYTLQARDGEIGRVEDFFVDDDTWAITEMVVDTNTWLPGGKVAIRPEAVEDIDWPAKTVRVGLTREEVRSAVTVY